MIVVGSPRYERLSYHDHEKQGRAVVKVNELTNWVS